MPNYQKSKIYKIFSYENNDVYYGSTVESLSKRIAKHRDNFKRYTNGKYNYVTSFNILQFSTAQILLVETYPCNSKEELLQREQYYIKNNECVNKLLSNKIPQNYNENKNDIKTEIINQFNEQKKEWYEINKEKILQERKIYREQIKQDSNKVEEVKKYKAEWYLKNKEKQSEQKKINYEANKEEIKAKSNSYYEANKDEINKRRREKRASLKNANIIGFSDI